MDTHLKIDKILCPTDFSGLSDKGTAYALALAQRFQAEVKLIHVYGLPTYYALPEAAVIPAPKYVADRSDELQRMLNAAVEKLQAGPVKVTGQLKLGVSYDEIVQEADTWGADLIALASHGYSGLSHALLGSVTERVLRLAHCPVLVVRGAAESNIAKILCPIDFSDCSERALDYAVRMACKLNADVHLVHAYEDPLALIPFARPGSAGPPAADPNIIAEAKRQRADEVERLQDMCAQHQISVQVEEVEGEPRATIVDAAERTHAQLIIMGTHGRSGTSRLLLGSVAERTLRAAPCPVLVVP